MQEPKMSLNFILKNDTFLYNQVNKTVMQKTICTSTLLKKQKQVDTFQTGSFQIKYTAKQIEIYMRN